MNESDMLLATDWPRYAVDGWVVTEKLDGCRAYWDGAHLWTRGGLVIKTPPRIANKLPACHLDCEVWAGVQNLQTARIAVQYGKWTDAVKLVVHDAPQVEAGYERRLIAARRAVRRIPGVEVVSDAVLVDSHRELLDMMRDVVARRGEGLVVRHPVTHYAPGRSRAVLKVFPYMLGL